MSFQNLLKVSILMIDNNERILKANDNYINQIEEDRKLKLGILEFVIDKAITAREARKFLSKHTQTPYSIVLLDLNLPISNYENLSKNLEFEGIDILISIKKEGTAEEVIVVSGYPEKLLEVFREGASDFISKPRIDTELQDRILICWSRLLSKKSQRILDQRISDLVPYAEKGLASMFTKYFYNLADEVVNNAEDLKTYIQERYGLEEKKDAEDTFFQRLNKQKSHLTNLLKEWEKMQNSLQPSSKSFEEKNIGDLLKEIHQSLLPCLIVKNLELELLNGDSLKIKSLENDVSAVFKEIIIGALGKLPDQNETKEFITINIENINGQVIVRFQDNLEAISNQDAKDINKGTIISPQNRFEREWGLSVVQHIAIRGGGRLEIEPLSQGNIVNYYIPSA